MRMMPKTPKTLFILIFALILICQSHHDSFCATKEEDRALYDAWQYIKKKGTMKAVESKAFHDAWSYFSKDDTHRALKIARKYYRPESEYSDLWPLLLGFIYYRQHKYQDAVRTFGRIRPKMDEHYYHIVKEKPAHKDREIFESLYYPVLLINGIAHYYLENWTDAVRDLEVYAEKYPSPTFCDVIAICCYRTKQYSKSLKYVKRAYQLHGNTELKDTAAYNAGVANAIMGNAEETISWLKIPLGHDRKLWLKEIRNNEDFDAVRNDKKFAEFLKQQENIMSREQGATDTSGRPAGSDASVRGTNPNNMPGK